MKPFRKHLYFFAFFALIITSCDNKEENKETILDSSTAPKVSFSIQANYNDEDFNVGTVYTDALGHRIKVENFQSYFSDIKLIDEFGGEVVLKDIAITNLNNTFTFTSEIPAGSYSSVSIGLGVPPALNKNIDPTTYPNDNPLSVQGAAGMFWTWNTGYIFTKYEGKADLTGTEGAVLLDPFAFHVGDDPYYRTVVMDHAFTISETQTENISLLIHTEKLINGGPSQIDIATDNVTHTTGNPELAERFANNFAAAFEIQ